MAGTIRKYFTCANSAKGFVNFFSSSLAGMEKIYILKGGPGTGKSTLMKKIGEFFLKQDEDVEYIYCSSDSSSLDGIIIPSRGAAVVDGTSPHVIEPQAPGAVEEYVNLGDAWDSAKLREHKQEILMIKKKIANCYDVVYSCMAEAKAVHDEWEKIYMEATDYEKLERVTMELSEKMLSNCTAEGPAKVVDRFLGAATPEGSVNFIENLTEGLDKRYFIKGRPGTGKSTMMKKIADQAKNRGFDVEIYHCSFDPDSVDMVILRQLGVCIFDSTAPHELFPSGQTDEIVDVYRAAVAEGTDEDNASQIAELAARYRELNGTAREMLGMVHKLHDDLEKPYSNAMDFHVIDRKTKKLLKEIKKMKKIN